ncbi:hypothetical protein VNO80_05713 [Phaseolus coccineus]|uniref:Uncharacterized protein n=1 Tax=Phaseolus coccineus TaxID=3886 RepID=A0AAN9RDX7_PHACN
MRVVSVIGSKDLDQTLTLCLHWFHLDILNSGEKPSQSGNALAWHPFHEEYFVSGSYDGSIFHWLVRDPIQKYAQAVKRQNPSANSEETWRGKVINTDSLSLRDPMEELSSQSECSEQNEQSTGHLTGKHCGNVGGFSYAKPTLPTWQLPLVAETHYGPRNSQPEGERQESESLKPNAQAERRVFEVGESSKNSKREERKQLRSVPSKISNSDSDIAINNCNHLFWLKHGSLETIRLWELGKQLGATCDDEGKLLISLEELETRDRILKSARDEGANMGYQ